MWLAIVVSGLLLLLALGGLFLFGLGINTLWRSWPWRWRDETPFGPKAGIIQLGFGLLFAFGCSVCAIDKGSSLRRESVYREAFSTAVPSYFEYLQRAVVNPAVTPHGRLVLIDTARRTLAALGIEMFVSETRPTLGTSRFNLVRHGGLMAAHPSEVQVIAFLECSEEAVFHYKTIELFPKDGGVGFRINCSVRLLDRATGFITETKVIPGPDPPSNPPALSKTHYGPSPDDEVVKFLANMATR
jgi:hypothetical protein